jgi:hypothetical protein
VQHHVFPAHRDRPVEGIVLQHKAVQEAEHICQGGSSTTSQPHGIIKQLTRMPPCEVRNPCDPPADRVLWSAAGLKALLVPCNMPRAPITVESLGFS